MSCILIETFDTLRIALDDYFIVGNIRLVAYPTFINVTLVNILFYVNMGRGL